MNTEEKRLELDKARDQIGQIAWLLDESFRIPGLNWRFGLDALLGLIPGAGDLVSALLGLLLLLRAFQFKLPGVVIVRMILNCLIDLLVGSVPLVGDLLDFAWKSNTKNMKLFNKHAEEPAGSTLGHWIFIGGVIAGFAGVCVFIIYLFYRGLMLLQG